MCQSSLKVDYCDWWQYIPAVAISALRKYTRFGGLLFLAGYEFAWEIIKPEPSVALRTYSSMWSVYTANAAYKNAVKAGLPGMLGVHTQAVNAFADHPLAWAGVFCSLGAFGAGNPKILVPLVNKDSWAVRNGGYEPTEQRTTSGTQVYWNQTLSKWCLNANPSISCDATDVFALRNTPDHSPNDLGIPNMAMVQMLIKEGNGSVIAGFGHGSLASVDPNKLLGAKSVHLSDHIGELCMLILIASSTTALVPLVYCTVYYCRRRLRSSCGNQEENTNVGIEYDSVPSVHMHVELTPVLVEEVVPNLK